MKNSADSLLTRARAYTRKNAGRAALTVTPLAALGITAGSAQAVSVVTAPVFNQSGTVTYPGDRQGTGAFGSGTGNIAGSALPTGANGVTGAKYRVPPASPSSKPDARASWAASRRSPSVGTGSGSFNAASGSIPLHYSFTLATTAADNETLTITGWTLTVSVTSSSGTGTQTVTNTTGGAGTFSGDTTVTIAGASGETFSSYAGSLEVNYTNNGNGSDATLSVTVPANSIDFNAVPEPSSWMILSAGVAGAGLYVLRTRAQRPQAAPAV